MIASWKDDASVVVCKKIIINSKKNNVTGIKLKKTQTGTYILKSTFRMYKNTWGEIYDQQFQGVHDTNSKDLLGLHNCFPPVWPCICHSGKTLIKFTF